MTRVAYLSAHELLLLAESHLDERKLHAALNGFRAAEALGADRDRCSAGRWMVSALLGNLSAAWRESDAIRARGTPDPNRFWKGESLHDKNVLVRCLHGYGDAVQFFRYAPKLRAIAKQVTFEVDPRFADLARCFDSVERVITWNDPPPQFDVQVEVMELPYIFRTQLSSLPMAERYLNLPKLNIDKAAAALGSAGLQRVGLTWSCGEWNPNRSIPFSALAPILECAGCEFWSLEQKPLSPQEARLSPQPIREAPQAQDSLLYLAALISQLDLVITVDTLAAHLAGALGIPCWLMLQHKADWRWMVGTSKSPWYPSIRLFRQPRPGDWASLVAEIRSSLGARHLPEPATLSA